MNSDPTQPTPRPKRSSRRHARRLRRQRRRFFLIGAAVLLGAALLGAGPVQRFFNRSRAARFVAESAQLLEQNDLDGAQARAQAAVELMPHEPGALRAMATALSRATNVAALQWWEQLLQTGRATESDRRACVEQAIRVGDVTLATDQLQRLLAEQPEQPANLWLAAQFSAWRNDPAQTLKHATQAATRDPANRQYNLYLAKIGRAHV